MEDIKDLQAALEAHGDTGSGEVNNCSCEAVLLDMLRKIKEGFDDWAANGNVKANPVTEQYVRLALEISRELREWNNGAVAKNAVSELMSSLAELNN